MKNIYITRRETFNAAHKLRREDWSDEKNELVFGKCANKNWHGHNFELFVTVKGVPSVGYGICHKPKRAWRDHKKKCNRKDRSQKH